MLELQANMTQRHKIQNGALMHVTTNTYNDEMYFSHDPYAHEAVEHLYCVKKRMPFNLYGFVIMPDHIHLLLKVIEPNEISKIIMMYKMGLSFQIGISPLWQKRFHLTLPDNYFQTLNYIHNNPVKAELCEKPSEYNWSSASGKWKLDKYCS